MPKQRDVAPRKPVPSKGPNKASTKAAPAKPVRAKRATVDSTAFMENTGDRSYHYIVDDDEHGNTVYDLVDTDLASWSAKGANHRSYRETAGISDHNFATVMLPETGNTHTDVGPGSPWDLFAADVASFAESPKGVP